MLKTKQMFFSNKKVKTSFEESVTKVSKDREASFNNMIIPKRQSIVDELENVIISLYAKGMSITNIKELIREVYKFNIPTYSISRITESASGDEIPLGKIDL